MATERKPVHGKVRVHLSTAMILMFVSSALLWFNYELLAPWIAAALKMEDAERRREAWFGIGLQIIINVLVCSAILYGFVWFFGEKQESK